MYFAKPASTAISLGAALVFDGSGHVTPATSSATTIVGISQRAVVAADADYASATLIPVEVPIEKGAEFLVDVGTGSATAALVGTQCDLTDSLTVNVGGTSNKPVWITRFISATKVVVSLVATLV